MQYILLAAGVGNRLQGHNDRPKCLLEIDGISLLARHINYIQGFPVTEILVVTGYRHEMIQDTLDNLPLSVPVRTVLNPDYVRGSVVSLLSALNETNLEQPAIIMDADVLYHQQILERLINSPVANCFLLDRDFEPGEEPVKLCIRDQIIIEFRKRLPPGTRYDYIGESVGFFRFSARILQWLRTGAEQYVAGGRDKDPHEELIRELVLEQPGEFGFEDITGLPWLEIDFPEDLVRAREKILPLINDTAKIYDGKYN